MLKNLRYIFPSRLLSIIAVSSLSSPVLSDDIEAGDVLYCTSDYFYGTGDGYVDSIVPLAVQNFKLSISSRSVTFGSSGYFAGSEFPIKEIKPWRVSAQSEYATFLVDSFSDKMMFNYANANPFGMALMKGTCDKF